MRARCPRRAVLEHGKFYTSFSSAPWPEKAAEKLLISLQLNSCLHSTDSRVQCRFSLLIITHLCCVSSAADQQICMTTQRYFFTHFSIWLKQCLGRYLGIIDWESRSSQCFQVQLLTHWPSFSFSCYIYSVIFSKTISMFHEVLNFNQLFLKLKRFIRN
jgi:hypothetical protein